ncbi:MAG TPA: glycosyl hydrolase 53 family protein [Ignavibacteriaceae bacterium]|nr:glycosyl hydrolase 53 family protein [Ignavibacteriaceae bacterium]
MMLINKVLKQILLIILFLKASVFPQTSEFIKGVDISFIPQIEDLGGTYYLNGVATDPLEIFTQNDINYIRLRLWHSPTNNYCGLQETLDMAERIKQSGAKFLLNFHYSDTWADPGNQEKPEAWDTLTYQELVDSIYSYTFNVIHAFDSINALPDMVQIGNEIIGGFLWPEGRVGGSYNTTQQWQQFTNLLKTARNAVLDAVPDSTIPIMIHIDRGADNSGSRWFFDNLNSYQVPFDIIGQSFYPWWHGTLTDLTQNINDLATRYNKEIIVVEVAYPWTLQYEDNHNNFVWQNSQLHPGYPASVTGQFNFLCDLIGIIKDVPNNKGIGVFYWAPEYVSIQPIGSPWENLTLFNFNNSALSSMAAFHDSVSTFYEEEENKIYDFKLHQNFPNPFNPVTRINYELLQSANVKLIVYNSLGEEINILLDEEKNAGEYSIEWNGKDANNNSLPSGIYLIKLITENKSTSIKAILLK